jgi:hypothetical protein
MKKPAFPLWAIGLLALLVGGLVAMNTINSKNVQTFADHDHDHDGKADHADGDHH